MLWFILFSLSLSSQGLPLGMPLPDGTELINASSTAPDIPAVKVVNEFEIQELPHYSRNKFTVQREITERDIIRQRNATWKTFFPEILAATLVLILFIIIMCYFYWATSGSRRHARNLNIMQPVDTDRGLNYFGGKPFIRGASMPELPLVYPKVKPYPKCSKPACVSSSEISGGNKKGKRKWNYKEDNEAYGPAPATNV